VKGEKLPFDESLESIPHVDERQISLDTDRSFVLYPVGGHRISLLSERLVDRLDRT
jgi:hypothetical protein